MSRRPAGSCSPKSWLRCAPVTGTASRTQRSCSCVAPERASLSSTRRRTPSSMSSERSSTRRQAAANTATSGVQPGLLPVQGFDAREGFLDHGRRHHAVRRRVKRGPGEQSRERPEDVRCALRLAGGHAIEQQRGELQSAIDRNAFEAAEEPRALDELAGRAPEFGEGAVEQSLLGRRRQAARNPPPHHPPVGARALVLAMDEPEVEALPQLLHRPGVEIAAVARSQHEAGEIEPRVFVRRASDRAG